MSFVYIAIGCLVVALYFIFMIWVYHHLGRKGTKIPAKDEMSLTILMACRNEASRLPRLAKALKDFKGQLIVIDDHSEDETATKATELFPEGIILKNVGTGKKAALKTGLAKATGSKVLCLDADILIGENWIHACQTYLQENAADLHLFPVLVREPHSFLACFEAFDMLGLMTITKASANANNPIMANGAALSINREDFIECQNEMREDLASGDDIFLLQAMKKRGKHIHFVQDPTLVVGIEPHTSVKAFLIQRIRWGQKSSAYTDVFAKRAAWIVLLANLWFCMSLQLAGALGVRGAFSAQLLMLIFIVPKLVLDFIMANKSNEHFRTELSPKTLFRGIIIYPFYIIFVGISGFFYRPYWKGRKV